jgi:hypothetical protein
MNENPVFPYIHIVRLVASPWVGPVGRRPTIASHCPTIRKIFIKVFFKILS